MLMVRQIRGTEFSLRVFSCGSHTIKYCQQCWFCDKSLLQVYLLFSLGNELSWSSCSAIWLTERPLFPCAWLSWVENYHFFGKWPGYHRKSICVTRSVTVLRNPHFIYVDESSHTHCWSHNCCFRLYSAMTTAGSLHWLWKTLFLARKALVNSRWPWRYSHSGWRMSTSPSDLGRSFCWAGRRRSCMRPVNDVYVEPTIDSSVRFVMELSTLYTQGHQWNYHVSLSMPHPSSDYTSGLFPLFFRVVTTESSPLYCSIKVNEGVSQMVYC